MTDAANTSVRVILPAHLRALAKIQGEIRVDIRGEVTQRAVLDAVEAEFPMLLGTIRDRSTAKRRPFVRFYACEEDLSHEEPDALLPERVVHGEEPFMVIGAMAGG
jgi:sulfur-carrier protein